MDGLDGSTTQTDWSDMPVRRLDSTRRLGWIDSYGLNHLENGSRLEGNGSNGLTWHDNLDGLTRRLGRIDSAGRLRWIKLFRWWLGRVYPTRWLVRVEPARRLGRIGPAWWLGQVYLMNWPGSMTRLSDSDRFNRLFDLWYLTSSSFFIFFLYHRYLNENQIKVVKLGMLPMMDSLLQLSLANNQITNIDQNALDFPKLQHL